MQTEFVKNLECGDEAWCCPSEICGKLIALAMKVSTPASGWLPSGWWDCMPVHMSHTVTIIVLLIGLTLLFSSMMHSSQDSHVHPSKILSSSITLEGRQYLHDLSQRASKIAKDQAFLTNDNPSISRINLHQLSCASLSVGGGNCSCNRGSYTFADVDDVEMQLLKPEKTNGVKTIHWVTSNTA